MDCGRLFFPSAVARDRTWLIHNVAFKANPVLSALKSLCLIAEYEISYSNQHKLLGNGSYFFIWHQHFLYPNPKWKMLNASFVIHVKWTMTWIPSHLFPYALCSACLLYLISTIDNLNSLVSYRTHFLKTIAALASELLWISWTTRNFHKYAMLKWIQTIVTDAAKSRLKIILKCELLN